MGNIIIGFFLIGLLTGCELLPNFTQEQQVSEAEEHIIERKDITNQLTNVDIYTTNAYLSDLDSSGFKSYDKDNLDHDQLLNLGFWLYVYEGMDKVNREEVDGRYYDVFNDDEFNEKINRYFACELEKKGNSEWLFQDNKYYHPILERGYKLNTVIQVNRIFDNGDGSFLVEGSVYRFESSMESNMYEQYLQPKSTWTVLMESELIGNVTATLIYSNKLNHYVIDKYQANYFDSQQLVEDKFINEEVEFFTPDQAVAYAKFYYGIDDDTLYLVDEEVYYDENGKMYYNVQLKSKSLAEAGGSEILFVVRAYEDETIIE